MKIFVTGGAGFIGSQLCALLVNEGHGVTAYDNLLLGKREYLAPLEGISGFRFVEADLLNLGRLKEEISGHELVFHLAANSDIAAGAASTNIDLEIGTIATYNTLEAARLSGVKKLIFASTSAIYGEANIKPTPENYGPLLPISFYGASKLACEALCSAFSHNFGIQTWIYRFANIVGPNATHGVIHDFVERLMKRPEALDVLGNGGQKKSYLHVTDCIAGMRYGFANCHEETQVFNLASRGITQVKFIAEEVVRQMAPITYVDAKINFGESDRGWCGDVPITHLSGDKFSGQGWNAQLDSDGAVRRAITEIIAQKTKGWSRK